jgi:hypothetical protein
LVKEVSPGMGKITNLDSINPVKRCIVKSILEQVMNYPYLKRVIIFGSSIRDDCTADSDIDIALEWTEDCMDEDYIYKTFTIPVFEAISMATKGNSDVFSIGQEGGLQNAIAKGIIVYEV